MLTGGGGQGGTCREIFYFRFAIQHRFRGHFERTIRRNKSKFGSLRKHFQHDCSWPVQSQRGPSQTEESQFRSLCRPDGDLPLGSSPEARALVSGQWAGLWPQVRARDARDAFRAPHKGPSQDRRLRLGLGSKVRVEAAGLSSLSPDLSPTRFTPHPGAGLRPLRSFVMRPRGCRCPLASDGGGRGLRAGVNLWKAEEAQQAQVWGREKEPQELSPCTAVTRRPSRRPRSPGTAWTGLCRALSPRLLLRVSAAPHGACSGRNRGPRRQATLGGGTRTPSAPRSEPSSASAPLGSLPCALAARAAVPEGQARKHQGPRLTHGQGRLGQWGRDQTRPPRAAFQMDLRWGLGRAGHSPAR